MASKLPGNRSKISILRNPVDRSIVRSCAEIHTQVISEGFLPTFGIGFLTELYDYIALSDRSFLFVASKNDHVVGFICGSYGNGSLYKQFLLRNNLRVIIPVLRRLFSQGVIRKIRETLRHPTGEGTDDLPGSEILNFCILDGCQGQGIGQLLFRALCDEYQDRGISRIRIVTGGRQLSAQRFYESVGARKAATIQVHDNVDSFVYIYETGQSGRGSA